MRVGYQRNWQATGLASCYSPGSLLLIPSAQSQTHKIFNGKIKIQYLVAITSPSGQFANEGRAMTKVS